MMGNRQCCQGAEISAAESKWGLNKICQKRAEKGPNFFKTLVLGIICGPSEINAFLFQLYRHILLEFVSFQRIFFQKQSFHVVPNIFCQAAEFI
jgi:hypothetical protein